MSPFGPPSGIEVGAVTILDPSASANGCPIVVGATSAGSSIQFGWSTDTNLGSVGVVPGSAGWGIVSVGDAGADSAPGIASVTDTVVDLVDTRGDELSVTFRFAAGGGTVIVKQVVYTAGGAGLDGGAG